MEKIATLLKIPTQTKGPTSERAEYVQFFADTINATRTGVHKPLPIKFYAVKLSHLSVQDLHSFKRQCLEAKSFSKYFWFALKPQKDI